MSAASAFSVAGKVAVITGAGSGLGAAIATALAGAGAHVVCADLAEAGAARTVAQLGDGGSGESVRLDVTDADAVHRTVEAVTTSHGRLDIMCNVAGVPSDGQLVADIDESGFDRIFAVHFKGVLFGCQAAVKAMRTRSGGAIVNMASTAIDTPKPRLGTYCVAKAAIAELTKVLALEVGQYGIRVNAVAPGFVETPLSLARMSTDDGRVDEAQRSAMVEAMAEMSPLRTIGTPEDVALQFLYLCSDAGRFITGQTLRPNGGASMPW